MTHQNTDISNSMLGATLTCLLSMVAIFSSSVGADEEIDVEAIARNLEAYGERLSTLRADIDKSRFVPLEQVDRLDYEPETIIGFVRDKIVFHPYEGALRGAAGTLQSRGGNSLDQSMLLGFMLNSAGYDARIVRADLPDEDALRLLRTTANANVPQSLDYLEDATKQLGTSDTEAGEAAGWENTQLYKTALETEKELKAILASAGIQLQSTDVTKIFLARLKSYFWIQYRGDITEEWQAVHPAFGNAEAPQIADPAEIFEESIPSKLQHTFTISAWIEQWESGSIVKHRIMKPWTSPVANLIGKAVRFSNAPSGLNNNSAGNLEAALEKTNLFMPMFNEALAPGARAFDLKGRIVDPLVLSGTGAGVFQTVGDKFESAASGVADRKDGKPTLALHSMYLEFTFTAPSGESDTRKRYLLAPRSSYDDDNGAMWSLITDHSYMVAPGNHPIDMLVDSTLASNIKNLDWLEFTIRKSFEPDKNVPVPDEVPADLPPLFQHWTMEQRPQLDPSVIRFRDKPALIGLRQGYRDAGTAFTAVDVVFNQVEHLRKTAAGLESAPPASMQAGVWDTVLESVPARLKGRVPESSASTVRIFELASQQGIEPMLLSPDTPERAAQIDLDEGAARFVREDLERGYTVVIPTRTPNGAELTGWWRVNADSGETLGMTGDGYGQDIIEYLTDQVSTAKGLVDALQSIKDCQQKDSMAERLCCLVSAHANNVIGLGFGGYLSAKLGSGAAHIFDIANTASTAMPGGQGLLPSAEPIACNQIPTDW